MFNINFYWQLFLRIIQYLAVFSFANILPKSDMGLYTRIVAMVGVVVAIGSLGNNVHIKNTRIQTSEKVYRLIFSFFVTLVIGLIGGLTLGFNLFVLAVVTFSISEILRMQLSAILLSEKDEDEGTRMEVLPLISGIILSVIATLVFRNIWVRLFCYSGMSIFVVIWLGRDLLLSYVKQFKFVRLNLRIHDLYSIVVTILISLIFLFENRIVGKLGDDALGMYGINASILMASTFYSKWIENKFVSNSYNLSQSLLFHTLSFSFILLFGSQLVPSILPFIGLSDYVVSNNTMLIMALVPINMLFIGLKLNFLYQDGDMGCVIAFAISMALLIFLLVDAIYHTYWLKSVFMLYFLVDVVLFFVIFMFKRRGSGFFAPLIIVNILFNFFV